MKYILANVLGFIFGCINTIMAFLALAYIGISNRERKEES